MVGRPLERLRGVPGRIARENTVRNPGRTAATAAALMIGLALVSFVTVFAAGLRGSIDDAIDKTIAGDLLLANTDGFSDIPVARARPRTRIDGVEWPRRLRYTQDEVEGESGGGYLTLVEPETADEVLDPRLARGLARACSRRPGPDRRRDRREAGARTTASGSATRSTPPPPPARSSTYTVRGTFKDNTDFIGDYAASDVNAARLRRGAERVTNVLRQARRRRRRRRPCTAEIDELLDARFPTAEAQNQQELKDSIGERAQHAARASSTRCSPWR